MNPSIISTRYVISPPFGNWVAGPDCTRILGSFTWEPRPGLLYHTLRSLRPVAGGWINQIGLRNRGIRQVQLLQKHIYSLAGLCEADWEYLWQYCPAGLRVELNLSCPNVPATGISPQLLAAYCAKYQVIAKLSPMTTPEAVSAIFATGVNHVHLCNTFPTAQGGISGRSVQPLALRLIRYVTAHHPNVVVIAGGGIYARQDVVRYAQAGARHFSLASIWLTPWRCLPVLTYRPGATDDTRG